MNGSSQTVLMVEDEAAILSVLSATLERFGYAVLAAATPRKAIHLARQNAGAIDLLLIDVIMPEMNGRDLANSIHLIQPGLKCLFMSGFPGEAIRKHGLLDEGVNFIRKPFLLQDLAAKIRKTLNR